MGVEPGMVSGSWDPGDAPQVGTGGRLVAGEFKDGAGGVHLLGIEHSVAASTVVHPLTPA
jgi:hypothetical protein